MFTGCDKSLSDPPECGYLISEMQSKSDAQLLREYAEHGNELAFTEIVSRHTDLVYSAALRQVNSPELACDITQSVFVGLARRASSLCGRLDEHASLAGWLCRTARNLSFNLRRDEFRRHSRESQAMKALDSNERTGADWEQVRPILDAALSELSEADHDAVVLRYFKNHDLRTVGHALGVSDDTAQKRVSRALEKLRDHLSRRGITTPNSALSIALAANAVQAAPAGLAATIASAALSGSAITTAAVIAGTKTIAMTSLQKTVIAATFAAVVGTSIYEARHVSRLRDENRNLTAEQEQLSKERDVALSAKTRDKDEIERLQQNQSELLRLRGEVGVLRKQKDELGKLQEENRQLRTSLKNATQNSQQHELNAEAERQKEVAEDKMNNAKQFVLAMTLYAGDNNGLLPTNYDQTSPYIGGSEKDWVRTRFNQFEIVYQGSMTNLASPSSTIVVRENQGSQLGGKWVKAYGFADGHSELKVEPAEGFEAWEKGHIIPPSTSP
jgi:RNA polymerase sigma factor (sigma-70 family)